MSGRKVKNVTCQLSGVGKTASNQLVSVLGVAVVVGGTAVGLIIGAEIVSRLIGKPITATEEIATYIIMWVYMVEAAYSINNRSYLQGGIVSMIFGKRPRVLGAFKVGTSLLSVVICFIISIWGYQTSVWDFHSHPRSALLFLPLEWARLSLVVGFVLFTVYFFVEFIDVLRALLRDVRVARSEAGTK